jgi:FtsZ-interacting cell division protein ZipA
MRLWNEVVAVLGDLLSLSLITLLMILGAIIIGLLWAFWTEFTAWLGRVFRRRRKATEESNDDSEVRLITEEELEEVAQSEEELPEVDAAVFATLADRYAAEGRYAEAVRERLRAMVRELVDRGVITHHPGWTVTELAEAAGSARPAVRPPVVEATKIFSFIWYRKEPALSEHDTRMRALAGAVTSEMGKR